MAQSGFTPIILFNSGTASNTPTTGNLAVGELAINYADGKLYYNTGSAIKVLAGSGGAGVVAGSNTQVQYNNSGVFGASASFTFDGTTLTAPSHTFNTATTGSTNKGPLNYGTLNFSDTGIVQSSQTSVNSYFQNVIQNTSNGTQASAEFIVYNDQGTATTNFATMGINSSGYSGTGSINAAGYGYFLTGSTDLVLGTIGANGIHFTTNSSATDALTISSAGAVSFPGGTANGVAYLNGSKVLTTGSALVFDGNNLGLGVTPSAWSSSYHSIDIGSYASFYSVLTGSPSTAMGNNTYGTASGSVYKNTAAATIYQQYGGAHYWYNAPSGTAGNAISFTQAMTLDNSGNFIVGATSNNLTNGGLAILPNSNATTLTIGHISGTSNGSSYNIYYYNGTQIGSITQSGTTGVLYNVTSDQRLKTDLGTVTSTDVIASTVIHDFTWKSDGSQARGVFAQEAAKVLPAAVKVGDDGEEVTDQWQVDYSKYVPDIIVELQSLRARVAQLETQKG